MLHLSSWTCTAPSPNVRLRISDISRRLWRTSRRSRRSSGGRQLRLCGGQLRSHAAARPTRKWVSGGGGSFGLLYRSAMPDLWSSIPVVSALIETLSFLSDDEYAFEFGPLERSARYRDLLRVSGIQRGRSSRPTKSSCFRAGSILCRGRRRTRDAGKKVALVSHRSATKIAGAQKYLVDQLRHRFGANRLLHFPVWANSGRLGRELDASDTVLSVCGARGSDGTTLR